jgi:hypothetical protein
LVNLDGWLPDQGGDFCPSGLQPQYTRDHLKDLEEYASELVLRILRLVAKRDLATDNNVRDQAKSELQAVLQVVGVPGRRGQPSFPNSKKLVKALAKECKTWLRAEYDVRQVTVSDAAVTKLNWWCSHDDDHLCATHLALPFLTTTEMEYVRSRSVRRNRSPKAQASAKSARRRGAATVFQPNPVDLTAAYLIHGRMHEFLSLKTVADYAFGTPFVERTPTGYLSSNPLLDRR